MSGIAGLFNRDRRNRRDQHPSDLDGLRAMTAAARHLGPDGERFWVDGALAIAHQWLRVGTRESPSHQWLVDTERRLAVTLDGRIDNREEVAALCGHHLRPANQRASRPGDADLIGCAFLEWREQCAERLHGDFAFVVWDGSRQQLYCARDVMGVRPFYYFVDDRRFAWATDLRQVLAAGIPREPNEAMVGEYLACAITSRTETLYRDVIRLPPAHWMSVTQDRVELRRYWGPDDAGALTYAKDDEYAEQFQSIFRDSVARRVEGTERLGAYLSGGLDSSSVVAMARDLGRSIESFSLLFPEIPEADERRYIDDVVARWGLTAERVVAGAVDGREAIERSRRRGDVLGMPSDLLGEQLLARMHERDIRVALTGVGGDYGLSGSFYHYADRLRAGDWAGFLRQLRADRRMADSGWSLGHVFSYGVRPLVPRPLRSFARPVGRRLGWVPELLPDWIGDRFASQAALADRLRPSAPSAAASHCRRSVCEVFESGWTTWFLEQSARTASEHFVEERHPFLDRRLVEFTIAMPEDQRWRGETTKFVLRRAVRHLLPDSVYARTDKGDFSAVLVDAIDAIDAIEANEINAQVGGAGLVDRLHIAKMGWVKQDHISAMYRELRRSVARRDFGYERVMFPLWLVLGVEHWFRASFLERPADGRERASGPCLDEDQLRTRPRQASPVRAARAG